MTLTFRETTFEKIKRRLPFWLISLSIIFNVIMVINLTLDNLGVSIEPASNESKTVSFQMNVSKLESEVKELETEITFREKEVQSLYDELNSKKSWLSQVREKQDTVPVFSNQ